MCLGCFVTVFLFLILTATPSNTRRGEIFWYSHHCFVLFFITILFHGKDAINPVKQTKTQKSNNKQTRKQANRETIQQFNNSTIQESANEFVSAFSLFVVCFDFVLLLFVYLFVCLFVSELLEIFSASWYVIFVGTFITNVSSW
jgi:hypothetical protein